MHIATWQPNLDRQQVFAQSAKDKPPNRLDQQTMIKNIKGWVEAMPITGFTETTEKRDCRKWHWGCDCKAPGLDVFYSSTENADMNHDHTDHGTHTFSPPNKLFYRNNRNVGLCNKCHSRKSDQHSELTEQLNNFCWKIKIIA